MKPTRAAFIARMLPRLISLESPTSSSPRSPASSFSPGHRTDDLGDLPRATVVAAMPHRHAAVTADRQTRLHLLQIRPAVLGLAPPGRREPRLGIVVDAIQRDRGHVPVQPRHIDPETG